MKVLVSRARTRAVVDDDLLMNALQGRLAMVLVQVPAREWEEKKKLKTLLGLVTGQR